MYDTFTGWSGDGELDLTITPDSDNLAGEVGAVYEDSEFSDIPIVGPIIDWIEAQLSVLYNWLASQWTWIVDHVKSALQPVITLVVAPVAAGLTWVKDKVLAVYYWVTTEIPKAVEYVKVKLLDVWGWITKTIPNTLDSIRDKVLEVRSVVSTGLSAAVTAIQSTVGSIVTSIGGSLVALTNLVGGLIGNLTGWLEDRLDDLFGWVEVPGTTIWDRIKAYFTSMWNFISDIARRSIPPLMIAGFIRDGFGAMVPGHFDAEVGGYVPASGEEVQKLKEWVWNNILDPVGDFFKNIWHWLWDKIVSVWQAVTGALKYFFTELIPSWFRSLWEAIHSAVSWIWDRISGVASFFWEELLKLVHIHSPISPEGGLGTLQGVIKVALALVGGLGLMTVAGNLVHPLHSLGLEHVSAMVYDLTNYKLLTGAAMGVIAAASIRTPLTWYFNALLRPNIPSERDASMMRSRQYISKDVYSQLLAYRGIPDLWHDDMDRLTETKVGYFALAAVARNGFFDRTLFNNDLHRAGYAEEVIGALLNMYQRMASEALKGLMSGTAVKRYKEGFTTEEQFHAELMLLGYGEQQWPQFLAGAQLEYAYDYLSDLVTAYRDAVRKGHISMDQYRDSLLGLGLVAERVEGYVLKERARLKPTEPLTPIGPPKAEYETDAGKVEVDTLRRQRRKALITRDEEIAGLLELGMPVEYAEAVADNDDARLAEKAPEE